MKKQVMLFGFDELPAILQAASAVKPFGAETVPVARRDYGCRLEQLAEGSNSLAQPYAGGPLGGRMMVFCGLERQMDGVLAALRSAGVGQDCLKAVLTAHNREWTPVALYRELSREHRAMQRGGRP